MPETAKQPCSNTYVAAAADCVQCNFKYDSESLQALFGSGVFAKMIVATFIDMFGSSAIFVGPGKLHKRFGKVQILICWDVIKKWLGKVRW